MIKGVIREGLLNATLYWAIVFYRDAVLTPTIPFHSQLAIALLIGAFIVITYLKAVEEYGIATMYFHHIFLGGVAILIFSLGQCSYDEMVSIGFNFSALPEKTHYYQYLLVKFSCNAVGVLCLPNLIEFGRREFRRLSRKKPTQGGQTE